MISAQFPNPKLGLLSPNKVSIASYQTPETIGEALALSDPALYSPRHHYRGNSVRQQLERSQSSEYFLEIRKSPGPKEPKSRKTNFTTIQTDATDTQPAFESDAFAIQMPTTREPVVDAPVFRAKLPSPSKAQVEAYQTYKRKAQQVRERNNSEGVRVPSKIVSYDYACAAKNDQRSPLALQVNPPVSPPQLSVAGSFPISPPIPQHSWMSPKQPAQIHNHSSSSISESSNISIARTPIGLGTPRRDVSRPRYHRGDADVGATSHTPSPASTPTKIKVRVKPKAVDEESPQKESWWNLYNRSPQSSTDGSRSPSPTKTTLNFAYTTTGDSIADTVFGYDSNDIVGTPANTEAKLKKKDVTSKRTHTSRWAWLRPAGPRIAKPAAATISPLKMPTYVDPFVLHATPTSTQPSTPTASRSASPKKLTRVAAPSKDNADKGKFETGFAQVTNLSSLVLKVCLLVYALVGLYFLLDAIREAVHVLGAPFRGIKIIVRIIWLGSIWLGKMMCKGWERWGFKIALKRG